MASTTLGRFGQVSNDDKRLIAYAECTAVSTSLGVALAASGSLGPDLVAMLSSVQNDLFDLTAGMLEGDEATADTEQPHVTEEHIERLERAIEHYSRELEPMDGHVLPGGTMSAALLYQTQVTVGRAQRAAQGALAEHPDLLTDRPVRYLDRLSSLLIILARAANADLGDTMWRPMVSVRPPKPADGANQE